MPSSYTSSLRLTLPATGELNGTWGTTVNTGITQLVDTAVAGYVSIAMSDADYTLSAANGATDEARNMFVDMTGTLTAARNVICPTAEKLYFFKNSTTGGYALTLKTSGGTGISVPNGKSIVLMCDGTNVIDATSHMASLTLASALPVASGGTGATSLTANNVLLGNGTSAVQAVAPGTSGNVLTSNGSTWQSTAPAAAGAGYTQVGTFTLSGVTASISFTGLNVEDLLIVFNGVTNDTSSVGLLMAVSTNNGGAYGTNLQVGANGFLETTARYGSIALTGLKTGFVTTTTAGVSSTAIGTSSGQATSAAQVAGFAVGARVNAIRLTPGSGAKFNGTGTITIYGR